MTFNAVWSDEQKGTDPKSLITRPDRESLAQCYAELAGEHPVSIWTASGVDTSEKSKYRNSDPSGASRIVFEVRSNSDRRASLSFDFDKSDFVTHVERKESGAPVSIPDIPSSTQ